MAQQTINVGTAPNDGTGTPLRTAFQYTNSNFTELYTATGPSGNNIVVPGSATITGDLTVDTSTLYVSSSADKVAIGTTSLSNEKLTVAGNISANAWLGRSNIAAPTGDCSIFRSADNTLGFGIASSTAMTLNATGLGVGTTPANGIKLAAYVATDGAPATSGTTQASGSLRIGAASTVGVMDMGTAGSYSWIQPCNATNLATNYNLVLNPNGGNVGIGVTPSAWSNSGNIDLANGFIGISSSGTYGGAIANNAYYNAGWKYKFANYANLYLTGAGEHKWLNAPVGAASGNAITFTQAMTLDASGNLNLGVTSPLINTTRRLSVSGTVAAALQSTGAATVETINVWHTATSGNNIFVDFDTEAAVTSRGSISYNRAGGLVAYNTTSDYRAKDIIGPVSNSGSLIDSLKVYVGKMKGATIERPMLIAHEAQEVAPYAVTGTKDEVDADGKPKYQQMDASALVPLLIAEIQSLRARVQTLETR